MMTMQLFISALFGGAGLLIGAVAVGYLATAVTDTDNLAMADAVDCWVISMFALLTGYLLSL